MELSQPFVDPLILDDRSATGRSGRLSDLDKEKKGIEDQYDTESATFLDKERIISPKKEDYTPDQLSHCGKQ